MTLEQLKIKYCLSDGAKNEPKADCRFCKGTGEKLVKRLNCLTFCICLFVDHEASDDIGQSLADFAKRQLEKLNDTKS